jgi:hypothetical protein
VNAKKNDAVDGTKGSVPHEVWQELDHMIDQLREGEGPIFCVTGIWPCFLREAWTMTISKELLDELLKGCERFEDLLGNV